MPTTDSQSHTHTNKLIDETSPYLLQHAHNPVDWYPWGEEAFAEAKAVDKPIFLSVGYSACHWCHVMERESFENEEVAAVMNEHFVNIKVDREERPDVDEIYMTAVQAMTGSGGWPMSVFLTHDLKPFYGGTYFPPDTRYGRPGFKAILLRIGEIWDTKRDELLTSAQKLTQTIEQSLAGQTGIPKKVGTALIAAAVGDFQNSFDAKDGGWESGDTGNKFPSSPSLALLLREYRRTGESALLDMVTLSLDRMAYGGIYDHLGGGFARYSTDPQWLVPHFEKMLYDNAQLAEIYLEAYQLTKKPLYRRVVVEILEYVSRDMRDEGGGFYSAEDADSEGEEGKFYLWTYAEIQAHLGKDDGALFSAYYGLKKPGNFSSHEDYHAGMNILHMANTLEETAELQGMAPEALAAKIDELRAKLLEIRSRRVRPGLDDKVLASWNALMISAYAKASQVLGDPSYGRVAEEAAEFLLTEMMRDGELLRTHRKGTSHLPAYLDDYAFFASALIDLYEATFDVKWIEAADRIAKKMVEKFWDAETSAFYFTAEDHKNLIVRTRPTYDGAIPSGNSVAALGLLRLAKLLDNPGYYEMAQKVLEANYTFMERAPQGYVKMLCAVDFFLFPPKEIAIVGTQGGPHVTALLDALHGAFVPNKVLAFVDPASENAASLGERLPLLAGKGLVSGKAAAYVCKDFACKLPVTTPEDFLAQLGVNSGDA